MVIRKSEKGVALPAVIMVMLITFTLSAVVLSMATSQAKTEIIYESNTKALHAAEAGINLYLWSINKEGANIDLDTEITFPEANPEYAFILHVSLDSRDRKGITSTGWYIHKPEIKQTVSAVMRKRSFTQHVYFTDKEPEEVWWTTGDKCYGPYRTNSNLYVSGVPEFYGEVYYADRIVTDRHRFTNPYFKYGAAKDSAMNFPTSNTELMTLAKSGGYYFEGRTSIMMHPNGTLTIWNPGTGMSENAPYTCSLPPNGVIYVNNKSGSDSSRFSKSAGNVFISGQLKGRLTVAAANDIYITDYNPTIKNFAYVGWQTNGVSYATTDFAFDSFNDEYYYTGSGKDMLGLIANRDIVILTKGWFDNNGVISASGDIMVYGAVMAITGSFRNSNHNEHPDNRFNLYNPPKLILRGALIQSKRGAVGTIGTWAGISYIETGYAKDYAHDTRMMTEQPPHFIEPEKSGWEVISWQ